MYSKTIWQYMTNRLGAISHTAEVAEFIHKNSTDTRKI